MLFRAQNDRTGLSRKVANGMVGQTNVRWMELLLQGGFGSLLYPNFVDGMLGGRCRRSYRCRWTREANRFDAINR